MQDDTGGLPVDDPPPVVEPALAAAEPITTEMLAELSVVEFAEPAPIRRPVRRRFLPPGPSAIEAETPPPSPTPPSGPYTTISARPPEPDAGSAEGASIDEMSEAWADAEEPDPADDAVRDADSSTPWWRDVYSPPYSETAVAPAMTSPGVARRGRNDTARAVLRRIADHPWRLALATGAVIGVLLISYAVGIGPLGRGGEVSSDTQRRAEAPPASTLPPTDPAGRVSDLLDRAQAGNAQAQLDLAILYAKGEGVAQDYTLAANWFRAAAEQGVARAQYDLGVLYERGRGVAVSYPDAFTWYQRAANSSYPLGQYNLAVAYTRGQGTRQDFAAAAAWYGRAASQGVVPAMVNLAILYERGEGVEASAIDAYAWYRAAAQRGSQEAGKRADELIEILAVPDRSRAEARANEVAASIHEPAGGLPRTSSGGGKLSRPTSANAGAGGH
jgi:TPR repeat protein